MPCRHLSYGLGFAFFSATPCGVFYYFGFGVVCFLFLFVVYSLCGGLVLFFGFLVLCGLFFSAVKSVTTLSILNKEQTFLTG